MTVKVIGSLLVEEYAELLAHYVLDIAKHMEEQSLQTSVPLLTRSTAFVQYIKRDPPDDLNLGIRSTEILKNFFLM